MPGHVRPATRLSTSWRARYAACVVAVAVASTAWTANGDAQAPPCAGVMLGAAQTLDSRLNLDLKVRVVRDPGGDIVQAEWRLPAAPDGLECIWVGIRPPGVPEYQLSGDFRLPPDQYTFEHQPGGVTGRWCYGFAAVGQDTRGEMAEHCVEVEPAHPSDPTAIAPSQGGVDATRALHEPGRDGPAVSPWILAGLSAVVAAAATLLGLRWCRRRPPLT